MTKSEVKAGRLSPALCSCAFASPVPTTLTSSAAQGPRAGRTDGRGMKVSPETREEKGKPVQCHPSHPSRLYKARIFPKSFASYQHNIYHLLIYHLLILPMLCTLQEGLCMLSRFQSS